MKDTKVGLGLIKSKDEVTIASLSQLFPRKKNTITGKTVELINNTMNDPEFNGYSLMETLTTYENVMLKNKGDMVGYINAIRFCAYLEGTEDSTVEAYKKTFSNRPFVQERMNAATDSPEYKQLTSTASRYRKSPMVVDILTQADVPLYLMFQGFRYKMANVLAEEAMNAPFSKDRINAADKFLTHVKPPENIQVEMDIGVKEGNVIEDYEKVIAQMVDKQRELIAGGADIKAITNASIKVNSEEIIDAEVTEEFDIDIHDVDVYEKYGIIVKRVE